MIWLLGYVGTIFAANWALATFGVWNIAGIAIPAGVLFAGLAFSLRDLVHESLGWRVVIAAIVGGAVISAGISPMFAIASGCAFLVSEFCDFAVYTPLRRRGWLLAVAMSNIVGFTIDSSLFLSLAFGSLDFLPGQMIGKGVMTMAFIIFAWWWKMREYPH